ncbi:MAG TPA: malto-oligosyltrehalose synthase [Jatrophihabitans sp.]|jgi:(1->4)-alpha-D-glucan 1-alpha-D-glucosylmutase|nr:malto-oligosyltrehalose synthase [Jatrophihabitans sp.]
MPQPTSSYRLQVRPSFDLYAAADVCDYLATLGVGAAYVSPLLPSMRGSEHGYDVVGYDTIDAQRGGVDGWTRLLVAARARSVRIVVDIVPNHTGIADAAQNRAWWDVLKLGRDSVYARWFDIDWTRGRLLLPVLGDDFTDDQLEVVAGELRYFEHRFPLAPDTGPAPGESAADVHARQHYELASYRRADAEQNYRRFFAITALAGLRVEDDLVFDATHTQIARWMHGDGIAGLRVDHPDGLAAPLHYLSRLRGLAGEDAWLVVEKILATGERLPDEWPVDGTTGYDALAEVGAVFVDPATEPVLDALYRELTADPRSCAEHVQAGKRDGVTSILRAEVRRMAALAQVVERADEALAELLVAFPTYRSYLPEGADRLATALERARAARPELAESIDALAPRLADPADELCTRFEQTCGAVMAKGVEDTAYYRYSRFVARNEVGDDPGRFGLGLDDFHAAQTLRQQVAARGMTTVSTHDTKRSEDVRARLAVLSELPDEWAALARHLMSAVPLPDAPFGYLLWQTFAGAGFISRARMHAYAEKAAREAAVSTSWRDPDAEFEAAVRGLVDAAYDEPAVREPLSAFVDRITPYGWTNSLGQKLVQLTMPGVPDVYQGTEFWDDSLVDPDNRRPVDFEARRVLLDKLDAANEAPPVDASGAAKLWLVSRTLRLRRDWPDLFDDYRPIVATGPATDHVVAFDRGGSVTVATRLPVGLERDGGWRETSVDLGGSATDVLTGRRVAAEMPLAELLDIYPVALLVR